MKKLMNLESVKTLNRVQQKSINGGNEVYMKCGDGVIVGGSSCSEWAMWHFCKGHGDAVICVGPIE